MLSESVSTDTTIPTSTATGSGSAFAYSSASGNGVSNRPLMPRTDGLSASTAEFLDSIFKSTVSYAPKTVAAGSTLSTATTATATATGTSFGTGTGTGGSAFAPPNAYVRSSAPALPAPVPALADANTSTSTERTDRTEAATAIAPAGQSNTATTAVAAPNTSVHAELRGAASMTERFSRVLQSPAAAAPSTRSDAGLDAPAASQPQPQPQSLSSELLYPLPPLPVAQPPVTQYFSSHSAAPTPVVDHSRSDAIKRWTYQIQQSEELQRQQQVQPPPAAAAAQPAVQSHLPYTQISTSLQELASTSRLVAGSASAITGSLEFGQSNSFPSVHSSFDNTQSGVPLRSQAVLPSQQQQRGTDTRIAALMSNGAAATVPDLSTRPRIGGGAGMGGTQTHALMAFSNPPPVDNYQISDTSLRLLSQHQSQTAAPRHPPPNVRPQTQLQSHARYHYNAAAESVLSPDESTPTPYSSHSSSSGGLQSPALMSPLPHALYALPAPTAQPLPPHTAATPSRNGSGVSVPNSSTKPKAGGRPKSAGSATKPVWGAAKKRSVPPPNGSLPAAAPSIPDAVVPAPAPAVKSKLKKRRATVGVSSAPSNVSTPSRVRTQSKLPPSDVAVASAADTSLSLTRRPASAAAVPTRVRSKSTTHTPSIPPVPVSAIAVSNRGAGGVPASAAQSTALISTRSERALALEQSRLQAEREKKLRHKVHTLELRINGLLKTQNVFETELAARSEECSASQSALAHKQATIQALNAQLKAANAAAASAATAAVSNAVSERESNLQSIVERQQAENSGLQNQITQLLTKIDASKKRADRNREDKIALTKRLAEVEAGVLERESSRPTPEEIAADALALADLRDKYATLQSASDAQTKRIDQLSSELEASNAVRSKQHELLTTQQQQLSSLAAHHATLSDAAIAAATESVKMELEMERQRRQSLEQRVSGYVARTQHVLLSKNNLCIELAAQLKSVITKNGAEPLPPAIAQRLAAISAQQSNISFIDPASSASAGVPALDNSMLSAAGAAPVAAAAVQRQRKHKPKPANGGIHSNGVSASTSVASSVQSSPVRIPKAVPSQRAGSHSPQSQAQAQAARVESKIDRIAQSLAPAPAPAQ